MRFKILIIEDEKSLLDTLTLNLQLENFDVYPLTNSVNALDVIQNIKPDLIILDIMLPHMSGIDFYQTLLNQQIKIPTIFLTAKNNIKDKIEGLKLGVDDYITKPFDLEELLLRIHIVLKHATQKKDILTAYRFNQCEVNFETYLVLKQDQTTETLSKREIALLKLLIENKNTVISREEILNKLWTKDENSSSRTIDNYILNFRKMFETNQKQPTYFLSIRGVGYKFQDE
ncbi:MAG: response regulator transcription factor [Bacteroidia bacterium]|jgi:two-component system alkaline phosphatase synthesis response regulator PhoP|nr:response regulator transcription factor [Bacteroidia bacterium]